MKMTEGILHPLVSVIITTKNEQKNIEKCLESIALQNYPSIEIIVVDNHSSDETQNIAKKYTNKVFTKGPERSAQRNYGMLNKSNGEYLLYLDADMILSSNLISACVKEIQENTVVALHISETVLGTKYFSRVRRFERSFYNGTPVDGARFFKSSVFKSIGGFDEITFAKGSGEDWDMDKMVKNHGVIKLLPEFQTEKITSSDIIWPLVDYIEARGVIHKSDYQGIYHNESEFELKSYILKKLYYGAGFESYINKWGKNDPEIKCQLGISYRFLIVFIEKNKWKKLIRHPILTGGMYFLRILVGFTFMLNKMGIQKLSNPY